MWRLVTVSPASKQQNTQVLWTELGAGTFTIWKFILNEPPPLSPPIFNHTSLAGMTPSCQVSRPVLHRVKIILQGLCLDLLINLSFSSKRSTTFWTRSGIQTRGAPLSSSPPEGWGNENRAISPFKLSPTICLQMLRIRCSPARDTPDAFSHLDK